MKLLSHVQLFVTPWTVANQAPLSMGFSKQEYWSGWPLPSSSSTAFFSSYFILEITVLQIQNSHFPNPSIKLVCTKAVAFKMKSN